MNEAPRWTSKPPSEPGLYWYALIDSRRVRRTCEVFVWHDTLGRFPELDGKLVVQNEKPIPVTKPHRVWAGPLLEPIGEAKHDGVMR